VFHRVRLHSSFALRSLWDGRRPALWRSRLAISVSRAAQQLLARKGNSLPLERLEQKKPGCRDGPSHSYITRRSVPGRGPRNTPTPHEPQGRSGPREGLFMDTLLWVVSRLSDPKRVGGQNRPLLTSRFLSHTTSNHLASSLSQIPDGRARSSNSLGNCGRDHSDPPTHGKPIPPNNTEVFAERPWVPM